MNLTDGIAIGGKHTYRDFDLYIAERKIGLPRKKSIRATVPYMNGYYDFSALDGACAWDERIIEYTFDVIDDAGEGVDIKASRFFDWLCNVHEADIFDDSMPNYHWHGSYETINATWDESGAKVCVSVAFVCYPFKIANEATSVSLEVGTHTLVNNGMAVAPIVTAIDAATVQMGSSIYTIAAGSSVKLRADMARGANTVIVSGSAVTLSYHAEVI